jgi:hypothetical protein
MAEDLVIEGEVNARQWLMEWAIHNEDMCARQRRWELECGLKPSPSMLCPRSDLLMHYWIKCDLLPERDVVMRFTNLYDNGTPQCGRVKKPRIIK